MVNSLGKRITVSLIGIMLTGLLLAHPTFAHNFVQNSNAELIAKIKEFKTESNLIASNISNGTLIQWHITKSQEYWGTNEINGLSQINSTLANNVSTAIDYLYSLSGQQNADPTVASQKANALNQMLDQAESEEISSADQNNATIQSLALVGVLNEALKDYGTAVGSTVDLTNMANMNMSSMAMGSSSSGNSMQGMSGMSSTHIVDVAAYQSSQALTDTAQIMFNNLRSSVPSSASPYLDKTSNALMDLKQAINSKESGNDIMTIVHMQIHPNLISAFNVQAVPEFPLPILLIVISFIGIVVMSRVFPKRR
jgi:hypothetical protein